MPTNSDVNAVRGECVDWPYGTMTSPERESANQVSEPDEVTAVDAQVVFCFLSHALANIFDGIEIIGIGEQEHIEGLWCVYNIGCILPPPVLPFPYPDLQGN